MEKTFFEDFKKFQQDMPELKLNATAKIKTAKGEYSFKYADLTSILKIARPLLHKNNFIQYWECKENGAVTCVLEHENKEEKAVSGMLLYDRGDIRTSTVMIKSGDDPKNQGAAITYAKRYSLVALLGLTDQDKDAPPADTVKKKMSHIAFETACNRIKEGDQNVVKDCLLHLNVSEDQKDKLAELEFQYNG